MKKSKKSVAKNIRQTKDFSLTFVVTEKMLKKIDKLKKVWGLGYRTAVIRKCIEQCK